MQRKYGLDPRRKARLELFDFIISPMMASYAESYAKNIVGELEKKAEKALDEAVRFNDQLKLLEESACPTCKAPMHPKAKVCWKCNHDGLKKSYDNYTTITFKMRQYVRSQHVLMNLAVAALGRSAKQKKKGPFVRQARAILEAALAEPEPGEPMSLLTKWGIGGLAMMGGILAYAMFGGGAYARSKADAWGSTADVGPPPTAEELAASP